MAQLNFHHLQYFWAVAHEGNLTRAAERLRVAPSAVSVQIRQLEETLGHPLFERRGRQLILTEAGRITLDHADEIFAVGRDLVATLQGRVLEQTVLRVGSMATLSRNFQVRFLEPLFRRGDVEIVVRSGGIAALLHALEAHHLDVVLSNTAPPRDALTPFVVHALASQPVSLVGPPPADGVVPQLATVLAQSPLLLPSAETGIRTAFDALVNQLDITPRIAAEVDDMAMLRLFTRQRHGVAVVPSIVVRDELASGELVELARLPEVVETFYAVTTARRFPNPLLKELLAPGRFEAGR